MRNIPDAARHDFQLAGEMLGEPTPVDPSRPNTMGRATPVGDVPGWPVYRTFKVCRRCHRSFVGNSFAAQYDDDEPQAGTCERCVDVVIAEERRVYLEADAKTYGDMRAKARRGRVKETDGLWHPRKGADGMELPDVPHNVWED